MIRTLLSGLLVYASALVARPQGATIEVSAELASDLSFERNPSAGFPASWFGNPRETIATDLTEYHGGKASARILRTAESPGRFSSLMLVVPMTFAGGRVELRGYIRTREVSGFAGLWMRQDGDKPGLAFDNMERRKLRGTTPWTEHSISLAIHPDAKTLTFGFLLSGIGTAWVDDLQLLVDGQPIWTAPKAESALTVLDRDREFAAGSGLALAGLGPGQVANLATLCRVWGLLKYHHPVVTRGERRWDYDLFRIMPSVLAAEDHGAAAAVLLEWVNALGGVTEARRADAYGVDVHLRPDLRWIDDVAAASPDLAAQLRLAIDHGPDAAGQFYVSLNPGVNNPIFARELPYPDLKEPDAGFRLLALFRLWNIVQYWFPYRDLIEDWDAVLVEFIPRVALAATREAFELEMMALIARIGDTHANLWSSIRVRPPVGEATVPVAVRFVEDRAVVTAVAAGEAGAAMLRRGDVVLAIDGQSVAELVQAWSPYYAASNEPTRLCDIARSLLRGPAGPVRLGVRRGDEDLEIVVDRLTKPEGPPLGRTHDLAGPTFRLLSPEIAYLKLSSVKAADAAGYAAQAEETKGWVIDIRNYPAEFVVFALGTCLVDRETEFARFTRPDLARPGTFSFGGAISLKSSAPAYAGRVVILVDEVSQSSAEYTAMAFRAVPGAIVVGSTTAGADGNVSRIALPGGLHTMISGIGVFYPDKRPTQRVGIVPDIEVRPTLPGVRDGRDEVLEAAVRQIVGAGVSEEEIRRIAAGGE